MRLLPLGLFALVLLRPVDPVRAASPTQTRTNRFEAEIEAFEAADKTNPPPVHAVLFLGSSSIRLWPSLQQTFAGHKIIQRGFGGSELSDALEFADRIVIPYRPQLILVYAGDNDLADGKSASEVLGDFKALVAKVHSALPSTRVGYIAIKPSLARWKLLPEIRIANRSVQEYVKTDARLFFIDVFNPMLGPDGGPRPELFAPDGLHLSQRGYRLWASLIQPLLDASTPAVEH